jgi:hypothetical protein
LNSFSPSTPIFKPKLLSATVQALLSSAIKWNNVVNAHDPAWLLYSEELLVASPKVKKRADGRKPKCGLVHSHLDSAVIEMASE